MSSVRLPKQIYGKWIWKKSTHPQTNGVMLMRREFSSLQCGENTSIWISAINTYQLFINGRLVGFGPRSHPETNVSYIDQHEIGYLLEPGINVVLVVVSWHATTADKMQQPGLWCQIATERKELLGSDENWLLWEGGFFEINRPRCSNGGIPTGIVRADKMPEGWLQPKFEPDDSWFHPDYVATVEEARVRLELHPLSPPTISEPLLANLYATGCFKRIPKWSQVYFTNVAGDESTYAAEGYIYSQSNTEVKVHLYADDEFKFFCNLQLCTYAANAYGNEEYSLQLKTGWNRLLICQRPQICSMGVVVIFPDSNVEIFPDTVADSSPGWNVTGALRSNLEELTPALEFSSLSATTHFPDFEDLATPPELLGFSVLAMADVPTMRPLKAGEFATFKLDKCVYGIASLEVTAQLGDVVDLITGLQFLHGSYIPCNNRLRVMTSIYCRTGNNVLYANIPADCLYLTVVVRRANKNVSINAVRFEELSYSSPREGTFNCSDPEINQLWTCGLQSLRRYAAYTPICNSGEENDCYLTDAYINAVNMAAVFGDAEYIATALRMFLKMQSEQGDIPVLTYSKRRLQQFMHMFALPDWINYNYRFSGNMVELKGAIPYLNRLKQYLTTMLIEEKVIDRVAERFGLSEIMDSIPGMNSTPTVLNALFCRFLLSASETYRSAEDEVCAKQCLTLVQQIADRLRVTNFNPSTGLFADRSLKSPEAQENLLANFFCLQAGILPLDEFENIFYRFFNFDPPFDRTIEAKTPYFNFMFMEMLFAINQREWALRYFRSYWHERFMPNVFAFNSPDNYQEIADTRFSKGHCLLPNVFILREILGIRIADVAHSIVYFNPAFKIVKFAEGVVPMNRGRLHVKWQVMKDGTLDVTLSSSVPIKVVPEFSARRLSTTTFRMGEQVILLSPPEEIDDED